MTALNSHTSAVGSPGRNVAGERDSATPYATVHVLECDDELGRALDQGPREVAGRFAVAPAYELDQGPWRFSPPPEPGALGALLLDGAIVTRLQNGERAHLELLGAGDVISPWVTPAFDDHAASVQPQLSAEALSSVRIALLDRRFALLIARWPEIHAALMRKLIVRSRRVSLQSAINSLPRIDERLELTLWHLADRFGYMTSSGVALRLPLKHIQLSEMVAAQRPSVSTAVSRLETQGRLARLAHGHWLLCGSSPTRLASLAGQTGL